jgi:tRNA (guanine37-N1)-methyltransferase
MTYPIHILTLFPDYFDSPLNESIIKRAVAANLVDFTVTNIRDFATDKHKTADDVPYGGGAGMVMKAEPVVAALEAAKAAANVPRVYLTPQGKPLTQALAQELSEGPGMILTCGHYEGIDQRVRDGWIDLEVSIGDFVLTGGEPAALILIDSVVRLLPGVLGNAESIEDESFQTPLLEYPQYTRPREFRGMPVPDVLLSGHHAKIDAWRREQALERTRERRPDLLEED